MKTTKQYIKTLKTNLRKFYQKWQEETSNKNLLQGLLDKMTESYSKEHRRNEKLISELQDMRRERDELLEERRSGTWLNRMHNISPEMGCDPDGEEASKLNAKMHEMAELRITNQVLVSKLIKAGLWSGDENPNLYPPLTEDSQRQLRRIFDALEVLIGLPDVTDPKMGLHIQQVADHAGIKSKALYQRIRNLEECHGSLKDQAFAVWNLLMKATNWNEDIEMNPDSISSACTLVQNLSQAWVDGINKRLQAGLECKLDSEGFPYIDGVPLTGEVKPSLLSNDLWKLLLKATGSDPDTKLSLPAMGRIEDKLSPLSVEAGQEPKTFAEWEKELDSVFKQDNEILCNAPIGTRPTLRGYYLPDTREGIDGYPSIPRLMMQIRNQAQDLKNVNRDLTNLKEEATKVFTENTRLKSDQLPAYEVDFHSSLKVESKEELVKIIRCQRKVLEEKDTEIKELKEGYNPIEIVDPKTEFQLDLEKIMNETKVMLVRKNTSYGDSALNPVRIFSRLNSREGLLVRIDDKLNRIINRQTYPGDNDLDDLIGYLFLLKIAGIREERKEFSQEHLSKSERIPVGEQLPLPTQY